jgi:hypothetical protein
VDAWIVSVDCFKFPHRNPHRIFVALKTDTGTGVLRRSTQVTFSDSVFCLDVLERHALVNVSSYWEGTRFNTIFCATLNHVVFLLYLNPENLNKILRNIYRKIFYSNIILNMRHVWLSTVSLHGSTQIQRMLTPDCSQINVQRLTEMNSAHRPQRQNVSTHESQSVTSRWLPTGYTTAPTKCRNRPLISYEALYVLKWRAWWRAKPVVYEGVSKSFRTDRLGWELQMIQLYATRCSCIAILWVSLVSFAAITLCVALFHYDPVRKLLDTPSYG